MFLISGSGFFFFLARPSAHFSAKLFWVLVGRLRMRRKTSTSMPLPVPVPVAVAVIVFVQQITAYITNLCRCS